MISDNLTELPVRGTDMLAGVRYHDFTSRSHQMMSPVHNVDYIICGYTLDSRLMVGWKYFG